MPILGIWASEIQASKATSFDSISTVTVGAGGASSITFSSIPSTYKHLQVRLLVRDTYNAINGGLYVTFNNQSSGNFYTQHSIYGSGAGSLGVGGYGTPASFNAGFPPGATANASVFGTFILDILDYSNTNKNKTGRSLFGFDNNGSGYTGLTSSVYLDTSAINQITFITNLAFAQYSTAALYGIRG